MKPSNGSRAAIAVRSVAIATTVVAILGGTIAASPALVASAATPEPVTLIDSSSTTWKYLEDNTDPAGTDADVNSWTKGDFPDSGWKTGKGSFGAKSGKATGIGPYTANTLLTQYLPGGTTDVPTFFFRTTVTLTAAQLAETQGLTASVTHDDALRVFVNGTKAVGVDDSAVTENLQYAGVAAGDPKTSTFGVDAGLLHAGTNTVAVALYQDRATSSDIYLDFTSLATVPKSVGASITDVVLNIGSDETQRNFAWYSDSGDQEHVQVAKKSDLVDGVFPAAKATSFPASSGTTTEGVSRYEHATVTGLSEKTAYVYRVGSAKGWSATYDFATRAFSGDYSFLFVGDPQIGASGNVANDQAGWTNTLNTAETAFPDTDFIFSAGDQVEHAANESEYDAFLAPGQLRRLPLATINGNHDVGSKAYEQHFDMPNWDPTYGAATSATSSGGDHWFMYNDVLYISLNSNSQDNASHNAFLKKVIAEHGEEARWKVVAFHHSIYSVASHANDSDIVARRAALPTILSDLDVDLVLMGHDHVYTRSFLMNRGVIAEDTTKGASSTVKAKDGDVLYVTANSSSGSKYYDIRNQTYNYAAVTNQEKVRNFSNIEVSGDAITVTTLRSTDLTTVDKVTLRKADATAPVITAPESSSIRLGSSFDPLAGVTALDDVDGDLTSSITVAGSVDTSKVGTYQLAYSVKDAAGNTGTKAREVTVAKGIIEAVTAPVVSGTAAVGETLTVTPGTWKPSTVTPTFQWLRNGVAISGSTAPTRTLTAADEGKILSVTVSVGATGYEIATATTTGVPVTTGSLASSKPIIAGTVKVGKTVNVDIDNWSPNTSVAFHWFSNGAPIAGAIDGSFTIPATLAGTKLTVSVTASKPGFTSVIQSSAAKTIAKGSLAAARPTISGTVKAGKTLTAKVGTWSPRPSFSYRWYANGKAIAQADHRTLKLSKSLVGKKVTVRVTGSKAGYASAALTSASTAKIAK